MKTLKTFSVFAFIFILLLTSASCKRRKSLAELRREERQAISQFIDKKGINVIHELPADTVFLNEKDYYLNNESGLYIHVANKGVGLPPQEGEMVIVRYYVMKLNIPPDTVFRAMEPNQYPADEFIFNNGSSEVMAFKEAASYMGDEGEAFLIVPSRIGSASAQQNITPYYYHIRTRIR